MEDIKTYIILFFCYSIFGWLFEVIEEFILERKFVNRGFLLGPYCPIYGCGGLLITIFLEHLKLQPIAFFVLATVMCAFLEYTTSYVMEKMFNVRWWDYSKLKFNINGRVCLEVLSLFGIMGCFGVYVFNPFIIGIIKSIPNFILNNIVYILLILFVIDNIISWKVISNIKFVSNEITDNTEEITKKVKEALLERSKYAKRIINAFPDMQVISEKIKDKINEKINERK